MLRSVLDTETGSLLPLATKGARKGVGVHRMLAESSTRLYCVGILDIETGALHVWSPYLTGPVNDRAYEALVRTLQDAADGVREIIGHNTLEFDRHVLNAFAERYQLPITPVAAWLRGDTAPRARYENRPVKLSHLTADLGLDIAKSDDGGDLIDRFNAVRKGEFVIADPAAEPALHDLMRYCGQDCYVSVAVWTALPELPAFELEVLEATTAMNDHGVAIDMGLAKALSAMASNISTSASEALVEITGGAVKSPKSYVAFKNWLGANGVNVPGVSGEALGDVLPDLPEGSTARAAVEAALLAGGSSLAKADTALLRQVDGHIRGEFTAADTFSLRWSCRGVQMHNLPRAAVPEFAKLAAIDLIKAGAYHLCSPLLDLTAFEAGKSVLRPMCTASSPDNVLVVSDFSRIEFQLLLWSCGATDKLTLGDPYRLLAVQLFANKYQDNQVRQALRMLKDGRVPEGSMMAALQTAMKSVSKADRQVAKPFVLGGGYGGGAAVLQAQCKKQGLILPLDTCIEALRSYAAIWPEVGKYRTALVDAIGSCVMGNGPIKVGNAVTFQMHGADLKAQMVGGASLTYHGARTRRARDRRNVDVLLTTHEAIMKSGQRAPEELTETKPVAHVTSATARMLMANAIVEAHKRGLNPRLTVHDELVCETLPGREQEVTECMLSFPDDWGIPRHIVRAETDSHWRYLK